jgi:hypothetical protein
MADPQRKAAPGASTVSECSATDCKHNRNEECHAGSIVVRMEGGRATCGTYDPGSPKTRP